MFMAFIMFIFMIVPICVAENSMFIEILPSQPISGQNFTVSVYNPLIINETPYLTDVSIIFLNETYEITDALANRELELLAPMVYIPTSFQIIAYKDEYNMTNKSVTILPNTSNPAHLFITVTSNSLVADDYFVIRVTDEFNQPIENATVSIQGQQAEETDGLTNQTGYIKLRAPNQKEITILAQKQGYEDDTTDLWIETKVDATTAFLTHPFLPVVIAFCILLLSIIIVGLKNRIHGHTTLKSNHQKTISKNHSKKSERLYPVRTPEPIKMVSAQPSGHVQSSKVEEINIKKPRNNQKIIQISQPRLSEKKNQSNKKATQSHQWFSPSETVENKVDELLSNKPSMKKTDDWFEGTDAIRDAIDKSIKQKKKKST